MQNDTFPMTSFSWTIISPAVFLKEIDKAALHRRGTGIPGDISEFFGIEDLKSGETRETTIQYDGLDYDAYFAADKQPSFRTRLFWYNDFIELLANKFPIWHKKFADQKKIDGEKPKIRFEKVTKGDETIFLVDFVGPLDTHLDLEAELNEPQGHLPKKEGVAQTSTTTRYTRDPKNREQAIKIHGTSCHICGFNFNKVYGKRGEGYIEVHHTKPLSTLEKAVYIDPKEDLVPVCANCHKMIHRYNNVLSIDEMKEIYQDN